MSSQVEVKHSDNPIIECPNCGNDGNNYSYDEDGNEYSTRSSHIGYCPRCQKYTKYYHCHNFISEDDAGEECNTEWCSVCGYAPHAPTICADCYGYSTFKQVGTFPDEHNAADGDYAEGYATLYRCSCGNEVGWIECEGCEDCEDEAVVCPECDHDKYAWSGDYVDCEFEPCNGERRALVKCYACDTVFCPTCKTRYDEYE